MSFEVITVNVRPATARREYSQGREYRIVPMTLIVPGVLRGSKGALLYPPEEIAKNLKTWDGIPLTVYHPTDSEGRNVSANAPGVLDRQGVGQLRNVRLGKGGKLIGDGWFDVEAANRVDRRVMRSIDQGQPIELSTGLYTDNEPAPRGSIFNGTSKSGGTIVRPYDYVAKNYRGDHLAILPDQKGACSLDDGCGVLVNARYRQQRPVCVPVRNVFCPTGEGGGVDATCSPNRTSGPVNLAGKMKFQGKLSKPKLALLEKAFHEASTIVESHLGPVSIERLKTNLNEVKLYDGQVKIVNDLRKYGTTGKAMGFYNRATKDMGVVAMESRGYKDKKFQGWEMSERILAHELAHAIDGPIHKYSSSPEFAEVMKTPSSRAGLGVRSPQASTKSEVFADLMREFLAPKTEAWNEATLRREPIETPDKRFPEAHAYFKKEGLI